MFSLHWNAKLLNIHVHWDVKDIYDLPSQHVYHKKLSTQHLQEGCPIRVISYQRWPVRAKLSL